MEDTNSSLTGTAGATGTESTENQSTGTQTVAPIANAQAGVQTNAGTQKATTGWDYKADPRWGKVFKSESDIINGYKSLDEILETKYKPTFKQYESLVKKFQENGVDVEKIDDYIKEFQTLKSPEYPANQVYTFLKELADDDITAQELDLALKDLNEKKLSRKYPGATKETREQILAQEKQLKELSTWKTTLEQGELNKKSQERTEKNLTQIQDLCKNKGFDFTDTIKQEFINHCIQNQIPTAYMVQEFRNKYDAMLDKVHEEKIKAQTLENLKKTNATTIPFNGKKPVKEQDSTSFEDKIKSALGMGKKDGA
jgi:hypothetical protein